MLNIALPKGRLGDCVCELFARIGMAGDQTVSDRRLVIDFPEHDIRYLLVKPSDVAIYVERGAADIGVAGKDVLLESSADVYELLDLGVGRCRIAVAAPDGYIEHADRVLRVATKYVNIARRYYSSRNREIDIIKLNGSIELAPILGLSDVIVDIVETGSTLRENHLQVIADVLPVSARLIANRAAYRFKKELTEKIVNQLAEVVNL